MRLASHLGRRLRRSARRLGSFGCLRFGHIAFGGLCLGRLGSGDSLAFEAGLFFKTGGGSGGLFSPETLGFEACLALAHFLGLALELLALLAFGGFLLSLGSGLRGRCGGSCKRFGRRLNLTDFGFALDKDPLLADFDLDRASTTGGVSLLDFGGLLAHDRDLLLGAFVGAVSAPKRGQQLRLVTFGQRIAG